MADNKVCYWNAEGLPYSKAPPPHAGEAPFPGGPMQALAAMDMESPQLMLKSACGSIDDADLVRPRAVYRSWSCSTESSMAQMIEEFASGGVLVSPAMSFVEFATDKYREEFAEHCSLLKGIDPICYKGSEDSPKFVSKYPQCIDAWPKIKAFGNFILELRERELEVAGDLSQKDRALIESAEVY